MYNLNEYDTIIIAFSGGKDSTATLLHVYEQLTKEIGAPDPLANKVELWHHLIDGAPGSEAFMDWPITEQFCKEFADDWNIPLYFSWREGGFKQEMLRNNTMTAPVHWENPDGSIGSAGGNGPLITRRMFPQVGSINSGRWCSAKLKIDVMSAAINNQERFKGHKTLVVTGERAEESKSRANYNKFEKHRSNTKTRTVDHWRPIHDWTEKQVWDILQKHKVRVHPAYYLGWSRLSCMTCIFGNADQWASAKLLFPEQFEQIAQYEEEFKHTIKRKKSVRELAKEGKAYAGNAGLFKSHLYEDTFIDTWGIPSGAYGKSDGPT